jgi:hypothetical protein
MITESQETLLRALAKLHFLTIEQFAQLYYSKAYIYSLLRQLYKEKYVDRFPIARTTRWGSNPLVYTLSHRGVTYLRELGIDAFQTHHKAIKTSIWLEEVLAINDFLIAATLLHRVSDAITLPYALHERTIRHKRISPLIPDAWMEFDLRDTTLAGIWLEVDMGTEQEQFFKEKIAKIVQFAETDYEHIFGTVPLTVAIATLAGEKRLMTILTWVEEVLLQTYTTAKADLFLLTQLSPGEHDPRVLFLENSWYAPYQEHEGVYLPKPLLELPQV